MKYYLINHYVFFVDFEVGKFFQRQYIIFFTDDQMIWRYFDMAKRRMDSKSGLSREFDRALCAPNRYDWK